MDIGRTVRGRPAGWLVGGVVIVGVLLGLLALPAEEVGAGGAFTVTSAADIVDGNPGDGFCRTPDLVSAGLIQLQPCTLRAAVMEANASAGAAVITLPAGTYPLTLSGSGDAGGSLDILAAGGKITVNGAGAASTLIEGGDDRAFLVDFVGKLELTGVTIQNSSNVEGGGGIANLSTLTVTDSVIRDNEAEGGGGLFNAFSGTATLIRTTVSGNRATEGAGAGSTVRWS